MAKKSAVEKNNRRTKLATRFAARRARLKAIALDRNAPPEERFAAQLKLPNCRATAPRREFGTVAP